MNKKLILIGAFLSLLSSTSVFAAPKSSDRYAQAKKEMPEDLYPLYRILERLIQTNKTSTPIGITVRSTTEQDCFEITGNAAACNVIGDLPDVSPKDNMAIWAIQIISSTRYTPNASADRSGLIRMGKSLLNILSGNPEATACVIAHEMAHITENHGKKKMLMYHQLDEETAPKIASAIKNAHSAQKSDQFWSALAIGMNSFSSGLNAGMGNYALANQASLNNQYLLLSLQSEAAGGAALGQYITNNYSVLYQSAPRSIDALKMLDGLGESYVKRTKRDIDQYLGESTIKSSKYSRELEKEADAIGITYVAKAGINPSKCLEVVDAIHKDTGSLSTGINDTHPGETERKEAMEKAISELPLTIKNKYQGKQVKLPLLPYVYDKDSQVVRVMPAGTSGMQAGKNNKAASVEAMLGN